MPLPRCCLPLSRRCQPLPGSWLPMPGCCRLGLLRCKLQTAGPLPRHTTGPLSMRRWQRAVQQQGRHLEASCLQLTAGG